MPTTIEVVPNQSIIYIEVKPPFKPAEEFPKLHQKLHNLADKLDRPIYRIVDLTQSEIDFATVVEALQHDTTPTEGSVTDWRFKPLFVGVDKMAKLTTDSLQQEQYGSIEARLFPTKFAAIEHAKQELEQLNEKRRKNM